MARLVLAVSLVAALAPFSARSWAQDRSSAFYPDPQKLLTIDADRLSVNDRNKTATFSGHVVMTQGTVRKRCASVVIHYHDNDIDRVECDAPDYFHLIN